MDEKTRIREHMARAVEEAHPGATVRAEDGGRQLVLEGPGGAPVRDGWARGATPEEAALSMAASLGHPYVPEGARAALARARAAAAKARPDARVAVEGGRRAFLIDAEGVPVPGAVGEGGDEAEALEALTASLEAPGAGG